MFAPEGELTPYGKMLLDQNPECEFCGRSIVARFGGIPSDECESCRADYQRVLEQHGGCIELVGDDEA